MANPFGRSVILPLTNKSGGSVIAGDVVILDSANNDAFTTTTSANLTTPIGIAQQSIASNAVGLVLVYGYAALVNVNASVTRFHYGATYTVAKQATDAGASRAAGTTMIFLTGGTTPDALLYPVDLAGAALTNPMTTAEDIIKGGTAGAPARLAIGAAGGALVSLNGAAAYNSGTSMPGSKTTGDRYWRTDLGLEAYWDGTRWLTTELFREPISIQDALAPFSGSPAAAGYLPLWQATYNIYVVDFRCTTQTAATNDGSHFWTVNLQRSPSATTIATFTTASDTAATMTNHVVSVNALTGTTDTYLNVQLVKTSTPGNIYAFCSVTYRLVLT